MTAIRHASFINQGTQRSEAEKAIDIPPKEDAFNSIRAEYAAMLKNQLEKGNNGIVKYKAITFSIEADTLAKVEAMTEMEFAKCVFFAADEV